MKLFLKIFAIVVLTLVVFGLGIMLGGFIGQLECEKRALLETIL